MKNGNLTLRTMNSRIFHRAGDGLDHAAILTKLLKTVYKLDDEAITSVLTHGKIAKSGETLTDVATPETISDTLTALDKTRIVKIKEDAEKESYQKGYGKNKGEVLTERDNKLKEKYGITTDLMGDELYDFVIAEKSKPAGLTEEDIKKSVTYQQAEARWKKDIADAKKASEDKVKELETTYKKEGTFATIGTSAIDILNGLNPILPKNAAVAATHQRDFLNELKAGYDYELHEDGKIVVMDKTGKVLEDGHGNTLAYEDHVKAIAGKRYDFAANNGGDNGGDKNDPKKAAAKKYPVGVNKPKNIDELTALTSSDSKLSIEDRRIVMDEYRERTAAK